MEKFEIVKAKDDFAKRLEAIKKVINYDAVCKEIDDDMKRLGIRK